MGRESRARMPFLPYMWLVFSFGSITTLIVVFVTRTPLTGYSPAGYFDLLMIVLLPQLVGHLIYNLVLRRLSATYVAVVSQLGVLMAAVLAFLIFAEIPGVLQLPGSLAVLVGILFVNLGHTR
jgi:drug/metabolite transporter (DMT)-like permease